MGLAEAIKNQKAGKSGVPAITEADREAAAEAVDKAVTGGSHVTFAAIAVALRDGVGDCVGDSVSFDMGDLAKEIGKSRAATVFALTDPDTRKHVERALGLNGLELVSVGHASVEVRRTARPRLGKVKATKTTKGKGAKAETGGAEEKAETPASEPKLKLPVNKDYFHLDDGLKLRLEAAAKAELNVWAVGPTGCGKTETMALLLKDRDPIKVSFNGESSTDELIGCYQLVPGEGGAAVTKYFAGALEIAMREGRPILAEEIDAAPAECNLALQRALERIPGRPRRWYNPLTQTEVEAKPGFFVWATANTAGGGDFSGVYMGTQPQNMAFRDRFVFEEFDYLPARVEVDVLVRRTGIDKGTATQVVTFAREARQSSELTVPVSTRSLLAFAELTVLYIDAGMPPAEARKAALNAALLAKCGNPTDKEALRQFAQRHLG